VLADTVGSLAVIVGAVVISVTDWWWVDRAIAIAIGLWILPRVFRLAGRARRIVMQSAPPSRYRIDHATLQIRAGRPHRLL
jgi:cobalt-zinc-cadmium efflux system protein